MMDHVPGILALLNSMFPTIVKSEGIGELYSWAHVNLDSYAEKWDKAHSEAGYKDSDNPRLDPKKCAEWVDSIHMHIVYSKYSYGGYMEDRTNLWRGAYMLPDRPVHVGVDFNVPVFTPVFCPADLVLVHVADYDEDQNGGWGGKIILANKAHDRMFVFGHLDQRLLPSQSLEGSTFKAGTPIGLVGAAHNNGGWYPHLHIQCSTTESADAEDGYHTYSRDLGKKFLDPVREMVMLMVEQKG